MTYKSARLIRAEINQAHMVALSMTPNDDYKRVISATIDIIYTELQPGDTMTGWEIIASLPIKEQRKIDISSFPSELLEGGFRGQRFDTMRACNALYRWNGEAWEAVE